MKLAIGSLGLKGELAVPGDKSLSHRSVMFASLAKGKTQISGFLFGEDCLSTVAMFRQLGVTIELEETGVIVDSPGVLGFRQPEGVIDVGNSGTTMRLGLGILATLPFASVITGDQSLVKRPMERVMAPLRQMGAKVSGHNGTGFAPLSVNPSVSLHGISYQMPVASAQVKSAILLAGLQSQGVTKVIETHQSRTHTEDLLQDFGVELTVSNNEIKLVGPQQLQTPGTLSIPGDLSSAAYFMVAAAIIPNSKVILRNVGLAPSRTGLIDVMRQMGASIKVVPSTTESNVGDVEVETSQLKGIEIKGELIPRLIDELPIIALLATQAEGVTVIADAEELKHKETNRIDTTASELNRLGAAIEPTRDGMRITGKTPLHGGQVSSHLDHRIGMTLAIASLLVTDKPVELEGHEAIAVSYPTFFADLEKITIGGH